MFIYCEGISLFECGFEDGKASNVLCGMLITTSEDISSTYVQGPPYDWRLSVELSEEENATDYGNNYGNNYNPYRYGYGDYANMEDGGEEEQEEEEQDGDDEENYLFYDAFVPASTLRTSFAMFDSCCKLCFHFHLFPSSDML